VRACIRVRTASSRRGNSPGGHGWKFRLGPILGPFRFYYCSFFRSLALRRTVTTCYAHNVSRASKRYYRDLVNLSTIRSSFRETGDHFSYIQWCRRSEYRGSMYREYSHASTFYERESGGGKRRSRDTEKSPVVSLFLSLSSSFSILRLRLVCSQAEQPGEERE